MLNELKIIIFWSFSNLEVQTSNKTVRIYFANQWPQIINFVKSNELFIEIKTLQNFAFNFYFDLFCSEFKLHVLLTGVILSATFCVINFSTVQQNRYLFNHNSLFSKIKTTSKLVFQCDLAVRTTFISIVLITQHVVEIVLYDTAHAELYLTRRSLDISSSFCIVKLVVNKTHVRLNRT